MSHNIGDEEDGEQEREGYPSKSTNETSGFSSGIYVAFEHGKTIIDRVYEPLFFANEEPTEGLEPPTV